MPSKKNKNRKGPTRGTEAAANQAAASPEDPAGSDARREEARRAWAAQKRAKEKKEAGSGMMMAWLGGGGVIAIVGVVLLFVLLSGGGDDDGGSVASTPVIDPRVRNLPVDQTEEVIADDNGQAINPTFSKTTIVGKAGDVIEITMPNNGSVAHNLHIAGEDNEYSDLPSADDWITDPQSVDAGETGVVRFKIDTPGTYDFQCDFHPVQQKGVIVLS